MRAYLESLFLAAAVGVAGLCLAADDAPPSVVDAALAKWGVPKIESMYPLDTGIRGNVHSLVAMPNGDFAALAVSGFHVFDGTYWSRLPGIEWPHKAIAFPDGRVVVSCAQGLVELTASRTGGYSQRVVTPPDSMAGVHALMSVATARGHLFGLRGSELLDVDPESGVSRRALPNWSHGAFAIGDELYFLGGSNWGLNRWDWQENKLEELSRFLEIVDYQWPFEATARAEGGVWILAEGNAIVGFDGESSWVWPGAAAIAELKAHVKCLVEVAPNRLAVGTAGHGLLIFDESGRLIRQVSKQEGLDEVSVAQVGLDGQGGLWVATKESLSRIALDFDLLVFDERHGLTDAIKSLAFFGDRLYLATESGLFRNAADPQRMDEVFELVFEARGGADIFAYGDRLFVGGGEIMALDREGRVQTLSTDGGSSLWQPSRFPDLMLAGSFKGVQTFERIEGRWIAGELLPCSEVYSMSESRDGIVWGGLGGDRVARIELRSDGRHSVETMPIPAALNGSWSRTAQIEGEVYINSTPCIRWDVASQAWVESPDMIYSVGGDPFGFEQVFGRTRETAYVTANGSRGESLRRPNARVIGAISSLGNALDQRASSLAYDANGVAWIGGPFGLARAAAPLEPVEPLPDLSGIRRLISTKDGAALPIPARADEPLVLQPGQDSLRIEATLRHFSAARHNSYQIYVDGLDPEPPEFGRIPFRELTNLSPGSYLVRVRGRNAAGQTTPTLDLPIVLLAHWYERTWAYALYLAVFAASILGIVRYATKQHIRKAKRLQNLVRERTSEIDAKNAALERQARTLEKQNAELAEKTDELEATTASLTDTLQRLQEAQEQLVAAARAAGKAEIATNVLHNVGNVLNSLNVSLATLSQKVASSGVSRLSRLASMLEQQRGDLARFIAEDPRGQHVPDYVSSLAVALRGEAESIAAEIASMSGEVERIKRIVAAQQAHAKAEPALERVNVSSLCQRAIGGVHGHDPLAPCRFVNDVPSHLEIDADKHRLLEILLNLLRNARDAVVARGGGEVVVAASESPDGASLALSVADDGVGFAPELGVKLFGHGFTTKPDGHGFGLHSAGNAARLLGGALELSSLGEGRGATATLTLPLSPRSGSSAAEPDVGSARRSTDASA